MWLYGGKKHIGAVALSYPLKNKIKTKLLTVPGHRESELAVALAQKAAKVYQTTALAMVGIHLDKIRLPEIKKILSNAKKIAERLH